MDADSDEDALLHEILDIAYELADEGAGDESDGMRISEIGDRIEANISERENEEEGEEG